MTYKTGSWGKDAKERSLRRKDYFSKYAQKLRKAVIDKYGGKCKKCGFSDIRALNIDHKNGGGGKEYGRGIYSKGGKSLSRTSYYKKVLLDTTDKYQILCANCNSIKKYENNECIPKKEV